MKSDAEAEMMARELADITARFRRADEHLRRTILNEARNGGFCLAGAWRIRELGSSSQRSILAACAELEDQGKVRYVPETFTYIAVKEA
jgi:hypothetical protein